MEHEGIYTFMDCPDRKSHPSTCFIKEYGDGTISIRNHGMDGDNEIWLEQSEIQFIREYLMRDVIGELEKLVAAPTAFEGDIKIGFNYAISLIRDGVKK